MYEIFRILLNLFSDPCTDYGLKGHKHNHAPAHSDHIYLVTGGSIGDVKDAGVQTALTMQEISNLEKQKKALEDKQANKSALLREAFVENVIKNDENVRQYTGFASLSLLLGIFNILVSKSSSLKYWSGPNSAKEKIYQKKQHYGKPGPATLNIPPFTRKCSWGKNKRLNVSEIKQTRKIAKLRIHVERAIQRLKLFKLLGNTIPWSLKPVMNQMVKVSAFICNLMPPLVRR
ncbi:hypothetical protein FSP39_005337 [Pinctada imbricata]|uniref:DDE Tnp4 domain-containing protein n=1 Tax=Pinctada imbricata TaxID=66713 RepID=A0AA89BSP0_PINIB|nr:hypothetical protein FSP39_005337 [Pinctada imbricata]